MVNERGERDETLKIRRVLVAMDASPHSRAALEAAIELASHFEAELRGLFVEDINMLRAVGLPSGVCVHVPGRSNGFSGS